MRTSPLSRLLRPLGGAAGLLVLTASPLLAHPDGGATHGAVHGFAHPLGGWDHLLAMVAVGLWAAQGRGREVWLLPLAFVGGMIGGGVLGMAGVPVPAVEAGILVSVMLLGGLVALAARLPVVASTALVALFGVLHGHAHGAEMPAAVSALAYAAGFCAATALVHAGGVAAALGLRRAAGQAAARSSLRLAGSAIGMAGVLLAVLR